MPPTNRTSAEVALFLSDRFFQVSLSMSGSCKVVIGFRASELVFLTFLHSHVGKATYPCLAFLSGGFFRKRKKI